MKSNRMRVLQPVRATGIRLERERPRLPSHPIDLASLPPPLPVEKIEPDRVIEDILIATLSRVQVDSSPEIAAAAEKYIAQLREKQS